VGTGTRGTETRGPDEQLRTHEYVSGFFLVKVGLRLGNHDQAISWLREAAEERDATMPYIYRYPGLEPLRSDPRFQALLRRMNFAEAAASS